MPYKELRRGAKGRDVEQLQGWLNRVGAMLVPDGDFGSGTETAVKYAQELAGLPATGVADLALWTWLEARPEPFPALPTNGVARIAIEETGGLRYYNLHTRYPHFPGIQSGITIGIGYDLKMNSLAAFRATWRGLLPKPVLSELEHDIGKAGTKTRVAELRALGIEVPFQAAWQVFLADSLPRYTTLTGNCFPSLPALPGLCQVALISLVYNRGDSVKGRNREEMAAIQRLLAEAATPGLGKRRCKALLAGVEDQLLGMQRLWPPGSGLIKRRQAEANLWRQGLAGL